MMTKPCDKKPPERGREIQSLEGLKVLIVDDDIDSLELTRIILEGYDMRVKTALSTQEALKIIENCQLDLLICDIAMPGEDGYSLIRKVRQTVAIPAIALTACAMEQTRIASLNAGFQLYITKPIEPFELVNKIANLLKCFL